MIKRLLILGFCLVSACAFAESNAYDAMQKFLQSRKYNIGFDSKTKRIIDIGTSEFPCTDMKDSIFTRQRMLYMKIAVLNAKADIIKSISSNISAQEEYKSAYRSDSKLGNLSQNAFRSQISCLAAMPLKGIITLNHAESYDAENKKYQIAVAVGWSAKSEAYALGTKQAPKRPNKKPGTVREWLKLNKKAYGSRTFVDKDGKMWFLGIAQYPLERGHSIAKSFASMEAQAIVNYSLYSDIASQEKAAQLMKNSDNFKGKSKSIIIEALAKNISQSVRNAQSRAVLLSEQEVSNPLSGVKYLAVAYGYAPEFKELKKIAKEISVKKITTNVKDDGYVVSFGTGPNRNSATRDALIEAIKMVNGAAIQSNSQMQQKFASVQAKLNDKSGSASINIEKFQKNIKEKTNGLVEKYKVIKYTQLPNKHWEVKLSVLIFDPKAERELSTIVVTPTSCEEESAVYVIDKEQREPAAALALIIRNQLEDILSKSNKLDIIDRNNLDKVLREQKLTLAMVKAKLANVREAALLGNMLRADYMLLSKLVDCKYSSKAKFDPRKGRVRPVLKMRLKIEFKVLDAIDSTVVLSKQCDVKLTTDEIKKAQKNENSLVKIAVAKAFKGIELEFLKVKTLKHKKKKRHATGLALVSSPKKTAKGQGSFYGIPVKGQKIIFILDRSGSMRAKTVNSKYLPKSNNKRNILNRLQVLKRNLNDLIAMQPNHVEVGLIFFGSPKVQPFPQEGFFKLTQSNRSKLKNFINAMNPSGGTPMKYAMQYAFEKTVAKYNVDNIYLLSDGEPDSGARSVKNGIQTYNKPYKVKINTVAIGQDSKLLKDIANDNGGIYQHSK
jgi:von Willebrand factor type A domain